MRGYDTATSGVSNFIFSFGCKPGDGVLAQSKYIEDLFNLFTSNFDVNGCIVLPDVFSRVLSSDAKFETVSSNLTRKLKLQRQDTVVGAKRLIYAIDEADTSLESVRKLTKNFFIKQLDFKKDDIIIINRDEFEQSGEEWQTKFSDKTKQDMNMTSMRMYTDPKVNLANQILNVAICETQGNNFKAANFFNQASNFELIVYLD